MFKSFPACIKRRGTTPPRRAGFAAIAAAAVAVATLKNRPAVRDDVCACRPAALAAFSALVALAAFACAAIPARAELAAARIFGDGMVLQREQPIPVWGAGARPGSRVTVELRDDGAAGRMLATASAAAGADGAWRVSLPAIAGARTRPLAMLVGDGAERLEFDSVLVGDVWLCSGQSNMNLSVAHNDDLDATRPWSARVDGDWVQRDPAPELDAGIRHFGVEQVLAENRETPQADLPAPTKGEGVWQRPAAPEAGRFTAAGFYFARAWRAAKLRAGEDVPVGIVRASWGGTSIESWMSDALLGSRPDFAERREAVKNIKGAANLPSRCYNSLLHPLRGFPVRGFIWYQGESNAGAHAVYRAQLIGLIQDWRAGWGLPSAAFIVVQLPSTPRNAARGEDAYPWMRASQAELAACADRPGARVLLAAYPDLGSHEPTPRNTDMEVHARSKRDLGERIALLVRRELDGETLLARGPALADGSAGDGAVTLRMDTAGAGLGTLDGQPVRGFEMAGADGVYYSARAVIDGDSIRLTSAAVKKPVSARYAWSNALHAPGERTKEKPFPPAGNLSTRDCAEKGIITGKTCRLAASSFRWETARGGGPTDKVRDGRLVDEFDTTPWDAKIHERTPRLVFNYTKQGWTDDTSRVGRGRFTNWATESITYQLDAPITDWTITAFVGPERRNDPRPTAALRFSGRLSADGLAWGGPMPFVEETVGGDDTGWRTVALRPWTGAREAGAKYIKIEITGPCATLYNQLGRVEILTDGK
jgi:hypothetical protein